MFQLLNSQSFPLRQQCFENISSQAQFVVIFRYLQAGIHDTNKASLTSVVETANTCFTDVIDDDKAFPIDGGIPH
jgi:hypothetical protein